MISDRLRLKYEEMFYPAEMYGSYIDNALVTTNPETGKHYICPLDETDEIFLDRIERSKQAGRNLFFVEWPEAKPFVHDPEKLY